jgi:putative transposase
MATVVGDPAIAGDPAAAAETTSEELLARVLDDATVARLTERARGSGVAVLGEGGLLQQLTKRLLEASLEGEMDAQLGYGKHDPAGRDGGNSRHGRRSKSLVTEVGPVDIAVPRDRDGSFEPQIVRKRQRRLQGVDGIVLSLSAKRADDRRDRGAPGRGVRDERVEGDDLHDHRPGR